MKRFAILASIAVLLAVCCVALLLRAAGKLPDQFYDASGAELKGPPGSIIRSEPMQAFDGAVAWRILYRSTGLNGEPIAVSGVVVAPETWMAKGGAPVVAWAHPTTGIARKCAPSLDADAFRPGKYIPGQSTPGLADMIKRGFVIAATDYVGLGTAGPHPYLVGLSAGRSVLDSVRAARALTGAGEQFVVWGHSQGAHAALWVGQIAADYAPDLKAAGVAAAAAPTDLASLFEDDKDTLAGEAFGALILLSWSRVYDTPLDRIVDSRAIVPMDWIGAECMTTRLGLMIDGVALRFLKQHFLKADPVTTEPWRDYVIRNTPTHLPPYLPLFIAQGNQDTVVLPAVTNIFVSRFCKRGGVAKVDEMNADHLSVASLSARAAIEWIADRFERRPMPNDCEKVAAG
ncbi:lipase family protein [Bradyrhizobium sp. LHD-71]|uniref:lipase family protein n=1 Tax=Bradyrhizobium sp. LHD-71 TaxID=3072141 RepID=UPI00280CC8FC|nr:lipase family protein [Bradyrhizobium sp. LHD-71]MDQ8726687.1 lipase family protein [Bradyrhizobium sp. LHD-71]